MKQRVPLLEDFINEQEQKMHEASNQDLVDCPAEIKSQKDLESYILDNIGQAFTQLLKSKLKINYPVTAELNRGYIDFNSEPLPDAMLGIMKYGIAKLWIGNFSGNKMPQFVNGQCPRYIWTTLHFAYEHGSNGKVMGGSNACSIYLPGENSDSIYYDILEKKYYTQSEAQKKYK